MIAMGGAGMILAVAPLTDVFWAFGRIPSAIYVGYAFAICASLVVVSLRRTFLLQDPWYFLIILGLVLVVILSFLNGRMAPHSEDYLIWFSWILLAYGAIGKLVIDLAPKGDWPFVWLEFVIFVICILGLQDWMSQNQVIASPSLLDGMSRGQFEFGATLLDRIRMRSTIEEAGHFALYLNMFVPLTLIRPRTSRLWFAMYMVTVTLAYIATLSLAAWAFMLMSVSIATLVVMNRTGLRIFAWLLAHIAVLSMLFAFAPTNELLNRLFDPDDISYVQRIGVYTLAIQDMLNADIRAWTLGYGPASFIDQHNTNPISWYLLFLHDLGLISFLLLFGLFLTVLRNVLRSSRPPIHRLLMIVPIVSALLHYAVTANFWHPWLWLMFPLVLRLAKNGDYLESSAAAANANRTSGWRLPPAGATITGGTQLSKRGTADAG